MLHSWRKTQGKKKPRPDFNFHALSVSKVQTSSSKIELCCNEPVTTIMLSRFFFLFPLGVKKAPDRRAQWFGAIQLRRTELIVEWRRGGLFHFAGHRAGDTTLASPLAVGSASTLDSHNGLFVLSIFSRGVVPVFRKRQHSQLTGSKADVTSAFFFGNTE